MNACNGLRRLITGWPAPFLTLADIFLGVGDCSCNPRQWGLISRLTKTLERVKRAMYPCEVDGCVKSTAVTLVSSRGARLQHDLCAILSTCPNISWHKSFCFLQLATTGLSQPLTTNVGNNMASCIPVKSNVRLNHQRARLYRAEEPEWNARRAIPYPCRHFLWHRRFSLNSRGRGDYDN